MRITFLYIFFLLGDCIYAQNNSLINTINSPYAKLSSVGIKDVKWTNGFWAERFAICRDSMVTNMLRLYKDPEVSHSYRNFEIAAGIMKGDHKGPPFHDGDFYKLFEALVMVYASTGDVKLDTMMDEFIQTIAKSQRSDGYIHTPVIIEERKTGKKTEFQDRLNFETYNMGHLMTAACLHFRTTGKASLLNVAKKAADYLCQFYQRSSPELARNAICPSHYMGVIELYRTTKDPKYLELARNLINIRGLVKEGTDDNQDRIPFRQQTRALGHAVRANYLYAGVTDVYMETGDDSLFRSLNLIWDDVVQRKLYITGGCGALYDGTSPDGTSYLPKEIQKVHQAYGRDYQLPNITAHNESCANIGNVLWNWRMLLATSQAKYADILEQTLYNAVLAGVSLDGKKYFYTNPLCVSDDVTYKLRWSKEREEYISYCNCCPPNTIRTVAEVHNYMYSISDKGLYVNLYGGNELSTTLRDGSNLKLEQETNYPWEGNVKITFNQAPKKSFSVFMRIPGWCSNAVLRINGKLHGINLTGGQYAEINRVWSAGDVVELNLAMPVKLIEANPLVEETRNQVTVQRGPLVYCLESVDISEGKDIFDIVVPATVRFEVKKEKIRNSEIITLDGEARLVNEAGWKNQLYREIAPNELQTVKIKLIPYYSWGNRGHSEMSVWLPVKR